MNTAPYGLELPEDRAPHYWAIACQRCPDFFQEFDDLKMVGGELLCAACRGDRSRGRFAAWRKSLAP